MGLRMCTARSIQFTTLYRESNIHFQPMAPSAMGAAQGSRMRNRTTPRPGKRCSRARASTVLSTMTRAWETKVKMRVLVRADRKMVLLTARRKFVSPTNWRVGDPVVALLTLR